MCHFSSFSAWSPLEGWIKIGQDLNSLREELLSEAAEAVSGLEERDDTLAAVLTGSAAWGKPNPDGDLDILLITKGRTAVLYRYLIPGFCHVKRRTELGYIPLDIVTENIDKKHSTLISCSMIEQLKNGRILFQKDGLGDSLIDSSKKAAPGKLTIGRFVDDIAKVVSEMDSQLGRRCFTEAILASRRVAGLATRALLLARERTGVSKEKHEYRAVVKFLHTNEVKNYEDLMGVEGVHAEKARETIQKTLDLMKWLLEIKSISSDIVNYDGRTREFKGQAP